MSEENKLHIKDIKKSIIPNYQRGYKWEDKNIKELLDDINSINDNEKKEHCLHNLTIIENNNEWEIIDGQQRLTTIFLILKYLDEEYYSLDYKIRTKNFLSEEEEVKNIIQNLKENKYKNKTELFEEVRKNKQDIYYICQALFTIHNWFNNKDKPVEKAQFIKKLKDNVYFYKHIVKDIKGETVFSNLNSGRVPLTDIELIKADLIINISDDDEKTKKIDDNKEVLINEIRSNIGRLWDEMESYLAQDEVWYWIAPEDKSVNKLSLLFNLLWSELKKEGEKIEGKNIYEKYYNYIYNENKVCDYKKLKEIWEKIKNYYYTIKDWYLDNDMYHLLGKIGSLGGAIDEFFENNNNK